MSSLRSSVAALVAALLLAMPASSRAGILAGRITTVGGVGVHPLDIDILDDDTGASVPVTGDTTTATGHYSITLPAGRYVVRFIPTHASRLFTDERKGVNVGAGTTTLDRTLPAGWRIRGRVVDGTGAPLSGVGLDLHSSATGEAAGNVQDDLSDSNGEYDTLVEPGTWDVEFVPTIASRWVPDRVPAVTVTADLALPDHVLEPGFLVDVAVSDQGFFPITDADIDVRPSAGGPKRFVPSDNTDAVGAMAMVLPAGTWDITATPPTGAPLAARTAWSVALSADLLLPVLDLPPAGLLTLRSVRAGALPVSGVDADVDSLPGLQRLETPGDVSGASGQFALRVPTGSFRITLTPPVASRLMPVRMSPVEVVGDLGLGDVQHPPGHWVDVQVTESGTGAPIGGANLDFVGLASGTLLVTADDVTGVNGSTRVVTDGDLYRLRVIPPSADWDTLVVSSLRTLSDTSLALTMVRRTLDVGAPTVGRLTMRAPWPSPSRDRVELSFVVEGPGDADLTLWDATGRRVASILPSIAPGAHTLQWQPRSADGLSLPAGLYWIRLRVGERSTARRLVLVR